jgi:hypothetical protein
MALLTGIAEHMVLLLDMMEWDLVYGPPGFGVPSTVSLGPPGFGLQLTAVYGGFGHGYGYGVPPPVGYGPPYGYYGGPTNLASFHSLAKFAGAQNEYGLNAVNNK